MGSDRENYERFIQILAEIIRDILNKNKAEKNR